MTSESFFKVVFIMLSAFVLFLILLVPFSIIPATGESIINVILLIGGICIFAIAILASIAVFVYKDAKKRGMNRWMWMTIAVFAPNLLGLVIYLVIRNSNTKKCPDCGKKIGQDYRVCPYCGRSLMDHCPGCGRDVSPEWVACPYCKYELKK